MNNIRLIDPPEPIRLVFELARADNPRLYDELIRFPKGSRRVNRVRVLAYDGLLAQQGVLVMQGSAPAAAPVHEPELAAAVLTNAVFASALAE
jgi:hypothetical protein